MGIAELSHPAFSAQEDMPLSRLALAVAEPFSPLLEAIAKENSRTPAVRLPPPRAASRAGRRACLRHPR